VKDKARCTVVFHCYLIAAYPILFLFEHNADEAAPLIDVTERLGPMAAVEPR
jgi:hypothetical protein